MTKYVFKVSKNTITSAVDSNINAADSAGAPDVKAYLFLDGQEVFWHTVTDDGGHLEYTVDLDAGNHSFDIKTERGSPTDIHVDLFYIDDNMVLPTQYNLWQVVYGYDSLGKHKVCKPFATSKDSNYIWYGEMHTPDGTVNTDFYRPHIVSDLNYWWRLNFIVTADKKIQYNHVPDITDVLYDSTESYEYYFCTPPSDVNWGQLQNYLQSYYEERIDFDSSTRFEWSIVNDDSSVTTFNTGLYQGPGTYTCSDIDYISDNTDESDIGRDQFVIYNYADYIHSVGYYWYLQNHTINAITVS